MTLRGTFFFFLLRFRTGTVYLGLFLLDYHLKKMAIDIMRFIWDWCYDVWYDIILIWYSCILLWSLLLSNIPSCTRQRGCTHIIFTMFGKITLMTLP
jgi:hypothetical protein